MLLTQLKDEGFFNDRRTNAEIREVLATKGYTLKPNEINFPLVFLTKQGLLKRERDSHQNQWVYFAA